MSSANKIFRIHGPYISESEIEKITSFLRSQGNPNYMEEITTIKDIDVNGANENEGKDELYVINNITGKKYKMMLKEVD